MTKLSESLYPLIDFLFWTKILRKIVKQQIQNPQAPTVTRQTLTQHHYKQMEYEIWLW